MAISIDWGQRIISVPKADTTLVQATPTEIRSLDLNWFRLQLKDLEDSEDGMMFPDTHSHNPPLDVGGVTLGRSVEIINDYTVTFEDGQWAVNLVGANSNVGDRVNVNQVSVRSANSAGLVTSAAIEFGEYGGAVTVDIDNGESGTIYPIGTLRRPSNNIQDATLIANSRGFSKIKLISNLTLDTGDNVDNMHIIGESHVNTMLVINDGCSCVAVTIEGCNINGVLDGGTTILDCMVGDVTYVNGHVHFSELYGTIVLDGNADAVFVNCSTPDQDNPPIIDMNGGGQDLSISTYTGILTVRNLDDASTEIGIGLDAGLVILEDTIVLANSVIVSGIGLLYDFTPETVTVNVDGLMSKDTISDALLNTDISAYTTDNSVAVALQLSSYGEVVTIDTTELTTGTSYPYGTHEHPVNNLADAKTIAVALGYEKLNVIGNLTLGATDSVASYHIIGQGATLNASKTLITIEDGCSTSNSLFEDCKVQGYQGGEVIYINCVIGEIFDMHCELVDCKMIGPVAMVNSAWTTNHITDLENCHTGWDWFVLDYNASPIKQVYTNFTGNIKITNMTHASGLLTMNMNAGKVWIDSSCTAGTIRLRGVGGIIDESAGTTVISDFFMNNTSIWDSIPTTRVSGSYGDMLQFANEIAGGRWVIDENQMVCYADDNITEVARFNLLDSAGVPAEENVFERVRV